LSDPVLTQPGPGKHGRLNSHGFVLRFRARLVSLTFGSGRGVEIRMIKFETRISKSETNSNDQNPNRLALMRKDDSKPYDLEERTFEFAKASRAFVKKLPRTIGNIEEREAVHSCLGINWCELHRGQRGDWKERLHDENQDVPARD